MNTENTELDQTDKDIIISKIREITFATDDLRIESTMRLPEDLGCDDLDIIEIVMSVEVEFGIVIQDQVVEQITTVQDVFDAVKNTLNGTN